MNKSLKLALIVVGIIILLRVLMIAVYIFPELVPSKLSLDEHRAAVTKVINKEYPGYTITSLDLLYSDWSSTVREADKYNSPTKATVIVKNQDEQITVYLKQKFDKWKISEAYPDYGPQVSNDEYFGEFEIMHIGIAVNIEDHIKERGYWIIPNDKGEDYEIDGESISYYTIKVCDNVYKTKDGYTYIFNKDLKEWEKSDIPYSDLCYYGNYTKITKERAKEILLKYASYEEK